MKASLAFAVATLALAGCASSQATQRGPAAAGPEAAETKPEQGSRGGMMGHDMAAMCPMAVQGTTVRADDPEGAAAMVFTTPGNVAELRRRVALMAEMHNHRMGMHGARGGMGPHAHGESDDGGEPSHRGAMQGGMKGGGMMMMPPSATKSEDVEGGARLVFTPRDPAELSNVREHVHQHAERMTSGQCPMMPMHEPGDHEAHHPKGGN